MKKIFSALVCTFVFMTFAATAQAALIEDWAFDLNIGFVNGDGTVSNEFVWNTEPSWGDWLGQSGSVAVATDALQGSANTTFTPLIGSHQGSQLKVPVDGTVRFTFDLSSTLDPSARETISFDVGFSMSFERGPMGILEHLTFTVNTVSDSVMFSHGGVDYYWNLNAETDSATVSDTFTRPEFSLNFEASPTATPEPATMLLMGAGLAGLGAIRRRRAGK